jgi:hypothetical protein
VLAAAIIALRMEAASTSETSVNFYRTTRRNTSEDSQLHTLHRNVTENNILFGSHKHNQDIALHYPYETVCGDVC